MTSTAELQRLISLSVADPRCEPEFLRALLTARLYVHLPITPSPHALQLVCFTRPDGLTVIPIFSDETKAAVAAQGAVRVGSVRGWDLFMSAPGATFMLDPNDVSTTLYPEEILALLADGEAATAPTCIPDAPVDVSPAGPEDSWIGHLVTQAVRPIEVAEAVYLLHAHVAGSVEPTGLLAVVAVPDAFAERVARAVALALQASDRVPRLPVDLTSYEPAQAPAWVGTPGFEPVWVRRPAVPH
ncbi:SseB family protein [Lysobacter humi (ex Lee et al. 2017)]